MTEKQPGTLSAHVDSEIVTREQLAKIETPAEHSRYWRPIPHIALVEGMDKALRAHHLSLAGEEYALRRDGQMLFGVLRVSYHETKEIVTTIGLRHANNKTMAIQMVAGVSVFVCDNMCFRGDMVVMHQRHDQSFRLVPALTESVGRWKGEADRLVGEVGNLKKFGLTDQAAKAMICDAFAQELMPVRFLPDVVKTYLEPKHPQFEPRNAWSLHNAFTEVAKEMPITTRMSSSQELGRFFGMVSHN
jgi:Domain of unknown function (DUF932)